MFELSIIIVNWNTKELTKNCIDSVYKNTKNIKFEIILIDNDSTDRSVEEIQSIFPKLKIIENNQNSGFAKANNQGIRIAKGNFILLLNSDTEILNNAIEKSLNYIRNNPEIGALGCKLLNIDGTSQPSAKINNSSIYGILFDKILRKFKVSNSLDNNYSSKVDSFNEIKEVATIKGAFFLLRKKAINDVGLLDERFFMFAEENDLCLRLRKKGWKVIFYPYANIIHLGGGSTKNGNHETLIHKQRVLSRLLLIKKHNSKIYYLSYRLLGALYNLNKLLLLFLLRNQDKRKLQIIKAKMNTFINMKI
jgi:GT2 family glycosyltransferase